MSRLKKELLEEKYKEILQKNKINENVLKKLFEIFYNYIENDKLNTSKLEDLIDYVENKEITEFSYFINQLIEATKEKDNDKIDYSIKSMINYLIDF